MTGVMNKIFQIRNAAIALLLVPFIANAQAVITEIMYDPPGVDSGHEWIEVYNTGTSSILLTSWKVYEGDANHNIIAVSGGSLLAPDTYAVIASNATKFQTDHPDYVGALFHSAFELDNGGATLTLRDKSLIAIDTVSYDSAWGGLGDGNSLQRAPDDTGQFVPHAPTPGATMSTTMIAPRTAPITTSKKAPIKSPNEAADQGKVKSSSQAQVRASNDAGNMAVVEPQTAAAAAPGIDAYWFFALAAVVLFTIAVIASARHVKKNEWDIVEESPEDV